MQNLNILSRFSKLTQRERVVTIAGGIVFVFLTVDFLVVRPLWDYYTELEERAVTTEKQLTQNMMNITRKDMIEKQYELYQAFIKQPATDEEETATMLSELESLARTNKVTLIDMKSQEIKSYEYYKEFVVSLDVEAEMEALIRFLHQVESSSSLMKVVGSKLTLKGKEDASIKAKIEVNKIVML